MDRDTSRGYHFVVDIILPHDSSLQTGDIVHEGCSSLSGDSILPVNTVPHATTVQLYKAVILCSELTCP